MTYRECKVADCEKIISHATICKKHWYQMNKFGKPVSTAYDVRPAEVKDGLACFTLGGSDLKATTDENFAHLDEYKWSLSDTGYARALINGKWVKMHRLVSGAKAGEQVDHINMDRLNNTSTNLRVCTPSENNANRLKQSNNTSGFKGIYKYGNKWRAKLVKQRKQYHLGTYDTRVDAAKAYDEGALRLFGEFANLNFKLTEK